MKIDETKIANNLPKKIQFFSILEMMTVVFIILLLTTLLMPAFVTLKMNARSSICKSQMRQMGVLIASYQTDHGGYLPNDNSHNDRRSYIAPSSWSYSDLGWSNNENNQLYSFWNGHILPYMDVNLPDKFARYAMVTKVGTTRYLSSQLGGPPNTAPENVLSKGWVVVDDAFQKGGYQDLRTFICPEVHQNTFDVAASINYNGVKIPRISQLCNGGVTGWSAFRDAPSFDYSMNGGIPTSYSAHQVFFGLGQNNSYRMDQIANVSQKAFLLEGGLADSFGLGPGGNNNGGDSSPYFDGLSNGGDLAVGNLRKNPQYHKMSYVHDNQSKFWVMAYPSFDSWMWKFAARYEVVAKFNAQFAPKAYMMLDPNEEAYAKCAIVCYVDPEEYVSRFKKFFTDLDIKGGYNIGITEAYTDDPNEYHYMTGNMNILFGDGSVITKDQAWIMNNRLSFSSHNDI